MITQADRDLLEDLQLPDTDDQVGTGEQAQHTEVPLPT
jgi:hypothetical protein